MTTLIIGASPNRYRYSYKAIQKLRKLNFDVYALGLNDGLIMDVKIQTKPINYKKIHTVSTVSYTHLTLPTIYSV